MGSFRENHRKLLDRVKRNLKPTLISRKGGVSLDELNRDYEELNGERIPYQNLRFQTLEAFLRSIPDVCSLHMKQGLLMVAGVVDESNEHIARMIRCQKSKTRKKKSCLRPPHRPSQSRGKGGYSQRKKPINHVKKELVVDMIAGLSINKKVLKVTVGGVAVYRCRVETILEGRVYGLFATQVERMYEKKYEEELPKDWCFKLTSTGAVRVEERSGQTVVFCVQSYKHSRNLPCLPLPPGSNWDISICAVTATNQLFFQFNNNQDDLEELVIKMNEDYSTSTFPLLARKLKQDEVCCASVNGAFYRVRIIDTKDKSECTCFFLDFGLETVVAVEALQELHPQFFELPAQAVPAILAKVKVEQSVEGKELEFVRNTLDGESFVAIVDNRDELGDWYKEEHDAPLLFLIDSSRANMAVKINKYFTKMEISTLSNNANNNKDHLNSTVSASRTSSSSTPLHGLVHYSDSDHSSDLPTYSITKPKTSISNHPNLDLSDSPTAPKLNTAPLPSVSIPTPGSMYHITVIKVTSPDHIQIVPHVSKNDYSRLQWQMTDYYSQKSNQVTKSDNLLAVGHVVAFRDPESNCWLRGQIFRVFNLIPHSVIKAIIKLVDKGCYKSCVAVSDVQPLMERFRELPSQACLARLAEVHASKVGWREEVVTWFREVSLNKDFVAHVHGVEKNENNDEIMLLKLYNTALPNVRVNINHEVMRRQEQCNAK